MARRSAVAALTLALLPACGPKEPAQAPDPAAGSASVSAPATPDSATPAKPAPAAEASPAEALARDLVKSGGRRIAYSAGKKRFVVPMDARSEGGRGLDLQFFDDEGNQREILRVCQPGECEERLDELFRELLPKLVARLETEGYEPISSIGWPSGRDEIDVNALGGKLRYERGKLSLVLDKKAVALRASGGKAPRAATLTALYPVPAAKLLGVLAEGAFSVFKLP
jgi:hypothetical protein